MLQFTSHAEQLASYLSNELRQGKWRGTMPGIIALEDELGVNRNTIQAAFKLLEDTGWLVSGGSGKPRKIQVPDVQAGTIPRLRIGLLTYERVDIKAGIIQHLLRALREAGHDVVIAPRSITELKMDTKRISKVVESTEVDAWIVVSGSRDVLEWFAERDIPTFAFFGRRQQVNIAGTGASKEPALHLLMQRLFKLGHKKIVLLMRDEQVAPNPSALARFFLHEMKQAGLTTGRYNLPHWENKPDALHKCIDALFGITPPTALLIDEPFLFSVTTQLLADRSIHIPKDVSLACLDTVPYFDWYRPQVAHLNFSHDSAVRKVVSWATAVAEGKTYKLNTSCRVRFVDGGTIGPPKH